MELITHILSLIPLIFYFFPHSEYDGYLESKFLVWLEGDSDNKRSITHYQYVHWPDFGNPPPQTLVELVRRVGASKPDKPMVVHCGGGLGRTGVFVTVHSSLECHLDKRHVDLRRTVAQLRRQREGMVQTHEQYRFCFEAIAEALLPAETDREQTDSRLMSYPPPPYQEKEDLSVQDVTPTPQSSDLETSPPPPPTSPPPPLSEPSTPIKVSVPETTPTTTPLMQSPTNSLKKKRLSEASVDSTPSRPISGEGEAPQRKVIEKVTSTVKQEVTVEVEPPSRSSAEVKPWARKVDTKKTEEKTSPKKLEEKTRETRSASSKKPEEKAREARPASSKKPEGKVDMKKPEEKTRKVDTKKPEEKKRMQADSEATDSRPTKTGMVIPTVMVTAPSTEQLNVVSSEKEQVPAPPTSPPPSEFPSEDTIPPAPPTSPPPTEEEEKVGFVIGDDQVIIEKPYSKADAKPISKSLPSNMPKWKHQPNRKSPSTSSSSAQQQLPKWKQELQRRKEEADRKQEASRKEQVPGMSQAAKKTSAEKVTEPNFQATPDLQKTPEQKSPQRVGKINIPAAFCDSKASSSPKPLTPKPLPYDMATQKVELAKSSGPQPTPPSSPAVLRKWSPKSTTPSPPSQEEGEKEGETTPPALRRLRQLQHKGMSSPASSPAYKLPVRSKPAQPATSQSSRTSTHSADTATGNVARLLAKFQ